MKLKYDKFKLQQLLKIKHHCHLWMKVFLEITLTVHLAYLSVIPWMRKLKACLWDCIFIPKLEDLMWGKQRFLPNIVTRNPFSSALCTTDLQINTREYYYYKDLFTHKALHMIYGILFVLQYRKNVICPKRNLSYSKGKTSFVLNVIFPTVQGKRNLSFSIGKTSFVLNVICPPV